MVSGVCVLGLQGDFEAHRRAMTEAGAPAFVARRPEELDRADGLIIPGGESTTLLKLMAGLGFLHAIRRFHASGRPIFGTCAGAILLASRVTGPEQESLGLIDIDIRRNAYGRQNESFETREVRPDPGAEDLSGSEWAEPLDLVFIRAPRIERCGPGVRTLLLHRDVPVLVRQGGVLAGTFHPEMTGERRIHGYFARMTTGGRIAA